jgi:hypothetical protein
MWARLTASVSREDLLSGSRFIRDLPAYLRHPVSTEEAHAALRHRLERREDALLDLLRRIFRARPPGPYRRLLDLAGCGEADVVTLVRRDGVESTLRVLARHGVYLTVDEFKGRQPLVRSGRAVALHPADLHAAGPSRHFSIQTSASRSPGTIVPIDLAYLRDCAMDLRLAMEARGGADWRKAQWHVPGGVVIARLLEYAAFGHAPERWFTQVDVADERLHPRYRWSARVLRASGWLAGRRLPGPQHVPLADPRPIARWMREVLAAGATPHLLTFTSSAAALSSAALAAGLDIRGAQFTVGGEPVTAARLAAVRRAGGQALPIYGTAEADIIGHACLAPATPDDVHLLHDLHALIPAGADGPGDGMPPKALLLTALRPTAPLTLLNVALGDRGDLVRRRCGCPLEGLGWATHVESIRGYDKLTAGGMTFLDTDVIRVLEEVLPSRFGGGPIHYQLVEDEGADGGARLRLRVDPAVGPVDASAIVDAFLTAVGGGTEAGRVMAHPWRTPGFLGLERSPPLAMSSGKILHLHRRGSERQEVGDSRQHLEGALPSG